MPIPFPRFTKGRIGKLSYQDINRAFTAIEKLEPLLDVLALAVPHLGRVNWGRLHEVLRPPLITWDFVIVTDSEVYEAGPPPRWHYAWAQMAWDNATEKPVARTNGITSEISADPFALPALNMLETEHASGMIGLGFDFDNPPLSDTDLELAPIAIGAPCLMATMTDNGGERVRLLWAPNHLGGECAA